MMPDTPKPSLDEQADAYRREYLENISSTPVAADWLAALLEDYTNGLLTEVAALDTLREHERVVAERDEALEQLSTAGLNPSELVLNAMRRFWQGLLGRAQKERDAARAELATCQAALSETAGNLTVRAAELASQREINRNLSESVGKLDMALAEARAEIEHFHNGGRKTLDRDQLGRLVREAWVRWAQEQPNAKPTWLLPYDDLSEADKEADRQIGVAIARWTLIHDAASKALRAPPPEDAMEAAPQFTYTERPDGNRYFTCQQLPGFHYISAPNDDPTLILNALAQFMLLWNARTLTAPREAERKHAYPVSTQRS